MRNIKGPAGIAITVACLSFAFVGCDQKKDANTVSPSSWADAVFSKLTDEQKTGQVFCLTVDPMRYFLDNHYKTRIQGCVRKWLPGGIVFSTDFSQFTTENIKEFNAVKLRSVVIELQGFSPLPLLAGAEFTTGAWFWDQSATHFPPPLAFGASGSASAAFRAGKITAREAFAQGLNWLIGPSTNCASTNRSAASAFTCFSENPDSTAMYVYEYVKGANEAGVGACLTWTAEADEGIPDSYPPLSKGMEAGAQSVLMPPLTVRADSSSLTMIRKSLTGQYGFKGIIVRKLDGLAPGMNQDGSVTEKIVSSFSEDQDMILLPDDPDIIEPFIDSFISLVRLKKLDVKRLDPSVRSILAFKEKLGLPSVEHNNDDVISGIGVREYRQTAGDIIASSITLLRNEGNLVPFDPRGRFVLFVNFSDSTSTSAVTTFAGYMERNWPDAGMINVLSPSDSRLTREITRRAREADLVVCTLFLKPSPSTFSSGLTREHFNLMSNIIRSNKRTVCVSFAGPPPILDIPSFPAFFTCYGMTPTDTDYAVKALFGAIPVTGKLSLSISKQYPAEYGITTALR